VSEPHHEGEVAGEVVRTGDAEVDAVIDRLAGLSPDAPLTEHVRLLTDVHDSLQRRLSATDG
jgi:hypothetical protein